jgi:hypothetical protein
LTEKPKDDRLVIVGNLKDIPSSEINKMFLHKDDNYNKRLPANNVLGINEIKPLKSMPTNIKKKKSKLQKWRTKMKKKQLKELIKKNNKRQKELKKLNLKDKNKKMVQKRNKWKYKGKKQAREIHSNKLSKVIDRIMSYKSGKRSELSTQEIRQRILNILTDKKGVIKLGKDCPKPKIGPKKGIKRLRKRLRSLNRRKMPKKRPMTVVTFKDGGQNGSKKPVAQKDVHTTTYKTNGKRGNVKSKITVRLGKKDKKRMNKKKSPRKKTQKKETNISYKNRHQSKGNV